MKTLREQPRLLADENFPLPSVRILREHGLDVLAVVETCPSAADTEILRLACDQGRWVATYDRDYGELVFRHRLPAPPAILLFRQASFPATWAAEQLLRLLSRVSELEGHFVVVGERSLRLHRLPE